jgi:hypothetical protein
MMRIVRSMIDPWKEIDRFEVPALIGGGCW